MSRHSAARLLTHPHYLTGNRTPQMPIEHPSLIDPAKLKGLPSIDDAGMLGFEAMALLRPYFLNQFTVTNCEVRFSQHG